MGFSPMGLELSHGADHKVTLAAPIPALQHTGLFMVFGGLISNLLVASGAYARFGRKMGFLDVIPECDFTAAAEGTIATFQDSFMSGHVVLESTRMPESGRAPMALEDRR